LAGETEVLGENLPQRHYVNHKSHLPDRGSNPGRRGGKPATNRLSYGAANRKIITTFYLVSVSQFIYNSRIYTVYTITIYFGHYFLPSSGCAYTVIFSSLCYFLSIGQCLELKTFIVSNVWLPSILNIGQ
jgi:hypothetical protein